MITYALVHVVPDLIRRRVEGTVTANQESAVCILGTEENRCVPIRTEQDIHLESEGASEDGGQEDRIPTNEGPR